MAQSPVRLHKRFPRWQWLHKSHNKTALKDEIEAKAAKLPDHPSDDHDAQEFQTS
jgi:hypothetical protein